MTNQVHINCLRCQNGNGWDSKFCGQCGTWLGDAKEAALTEANRIVATHAEGHAAHDRSVRFYGFVFIGLTAATLLEILMVEFVPIQAIRLLGLFSMSTVKFLLVAMFFMHLKGDNRMYGVMFCAGLFIAVGVIFSLLALFKL